MTADRDPDDPLVEDLRDWLRRDDPVPPLVATTAKASLGWRRLDADLAELLSDSALGLPGLPALARGSAGVRSVSLAAGRLTIDVEIQRVGDERQMLGQLSPQEDATIELQWPGGSGEGAAPTVTKADSLGRFRIALPETTAVRLRVGIRDPTAPERLNWTETSWIPL